MEVYVALGFDPARKPPRHGMPTLFIDFYLDTDKLSFRQ